MEGHPRKVQVDPRLFFSRRTRSKAFGELESKMREFLNERIPQRKILKTRAKGIMQEINKKWQEGKITFGEMIDAKSVLTEIYRKKWKQCFSEI